MFLKGFDLNSLFFLSFFFLVFFLKHSIALLMPSYIIIRNVDFYRFPIFLIFDQRYQNRTLTT